MKHRRFYDVDTVPALKALSEAANAATAQLHAALRVAVPPFARAVPSARHDNDTRRHRCCARNADVDELLRLSSLVFDLADDRRFSLDERSAAWAVACTGDALMSVNEARRDLMRVLAGELVLPPDDVGGGHGMR
jgi:hypothetical protein